MPGVTPHGPDHLGHAILLEETAAREPITIERAILISLAIHLLIFLVVLYAPKPQRAVVVEQTPEQEKPVPITFVVPRPPSPPPPPTAERRVPREEAMAMLRPPERPDASKPFRMQPAPEPVPKPQKPKTDAEARNRGLEDPVATAQAGGVMGGPQPTPTPGTPRTGSSTPSSDNGSLESSDTPPRDLAGRLRDFRRALEQPRPGPPTRKGPEGGGDGPGGLDLKGLAPSGTDIGNLEFESRDYDWNDYARAIYWEIWRRWHNRLLITVPVFEKWAARHAPLVDHQSKVRFTIERSGKVRDVVIETASGCYPLDDSATEALLEAVLPPLPDDFPRGQETVHARFIMEGDIRGLRPNLEAMKARGWF